MAEAPPAFPVPAQPPEVAEEHAGGQGGQADRGDGGPRRADVGVTVRLLAGG